MKLSDSYSRIFMPELILLLLQVFFCFFFPKTVVDFPVCT